MSPQHVITLADSLLITDDILEDRQAFLTDVLPNSILFPRLAPLRVYGLFYLTFTLPRHTSIIWNGTAENVRYVFGKILGGGGVQLAWLIIFGTFFPAVSSVCWR